MLVRLLVKNLFSFKELTEFNTAPGRFSRLPHHVYQAAGVNVLKLNAVYGANGAGKSNMIRVLQLLQQFILSAKLPSEFILETFKLDPDSRSKDVYIGVEFVRQETPYYYGLTLNYGTIVEEELLISGLGQAEDKLLFRRENVSKSSSQDIRLVFPHNVVSDPSALSYLKALEDFTERSHPTLFNMRNTNQAVLSLHRTAVEWFVDDLSMLLPHSRAIGLAIQMEQNPGFLKFAQELFRTLSTGVSSIRIETIPIERYYGEENWDKAELIKAELAGNPELVKPVLTREDEVSFVQIEGNVYGKRLKFVHEVNGYEIEFTAAQESDGTRRLIDLLPVFYSTIDAGKVYIIDEIERSIHPLMIKELVRKFSHDPNTKGQLIFSTHESNLLDQDILRPDEIWFAEKNKEGATELTTLSEFREHHTIDIRKGYLAGRYGGIPFLGNLKDLNWDKYAETDQV